MLSSQFNVLVPMLCFYVVRWQQLSWRDEQNLSSFPVCLSWFHLGATGTKWDSLRGSVALSFSLSGASQNPMCSHLLPLHTPVLCLPLSTPFSLFSEWLILALFLLPPPSSLGFWLFFHPFFLFIHTHFLLITDYQLCRTPLKHFLIICIQNGCILFERWNTEGWT